MVKLIGKEKLKTAVVISGRGSNLKSLYKFSKKIKSPIFIKLVVTDNKKAKGLLFAKNKKLKILKVATQIEVLQKKKLKKC